jgi:hypothetical protein
MHTCIQTYINTYTQTCTYLHTYIRTPLHTSHSNAIRILQANEMASDGIGQAQIALTINGGVDTL